MFENLRYKIVLWSIKRLTPNLFEKLKLMNVVGQINNISLRRNDFPRPMISKVNELFGIQELKGVEIGVRVGYNALSILETLNMRSLYLVDPYLNYEGIDEQTNQEKNYQIVRERFQYCKNVRIIRDFSEDASLYFKDESLDFTYIDGNHDYEYVYDDLEAWFPKIKPNGIIGGHDVFKKGDVLNAVHNWSLSNKQKYYIELPDWYIIKR